MLTGRFLLAHEKAGENAVNVRDEDDETPLFFCEDVPTAKLLLELGADAALQNKSGMSAAENAAVNNWADVAAFLWDVTGKEPVPRRELLVRLGEEDDEEVQEQELERGNGAEQEDDARIDEMLSRVEEVMADAERTGQDPTEQLREIVGQSVAQQILEGYRAAN